MTTTAEPTIQTRYLHPDALYNEPYKSIPLHLEPYEAGSGVELIEQGDFVVVLAIGDRLVRIEAPGEGMLRLRYGLSGRREIEPSTTEKLGLLPLDALSPVPLETSRTERGWRFSSGDLVLELDAASGDWKMARRDGAELWQTRGGGFQFSSEAPEYGAGQRFFCEAVQEKDEHFIGFGGRIAPLDRKGQSVDMFSVKTGTASGDYGGFPLPYFISTKGYGLFLNNPWPHVYFDMGRTRPDRWWMHAPGGDCDVFLFDGPAVSDVVRRYTAVVGRVPAVPRWMLGFWVSSLTFNSGQAALEDARRLREEGYPCDAFVFDGPWRGGKDFGAAYQTSQEYPSNDMEWHPDFGDGPETVRKLEAKGIKTVLHLNSRNFRDETAEKGVAAGLLRRQGDEVVLRVTDEESERYYRSLIEPRIEEGVAAWWTDHSDRVSGELAPGLPSRNLFGPLWNRLLNKIMSDHGKPWHLSLSRGGGIGSQPYAIPWPGDTRCGLEAMADDIWFMLSAGLSGFPITSVDVGGFTITGHPVNDYASREERNEEMFQDENICRRVCQFFLFTPVPRIHNNLETIAKLPWNCNEKTRPLYKRALEERYRLTPYLYSYALAATRTGEPLLRPLVYHHMDDAAALEWSTEFYLGEFLLVAPVTREGVSRWEVYLPEGRWTHLWSGRRFEGGQVIEVDAPLHEMEGLPIFVRDGAILVRQPMTESLGDRVPDALEIDVYPGDTESAFDLHETPTCASRFSVRREAGGVKVCLENNTELERTYTVRVHYPGEDVPQAREVRMEPGSRTDVVLPAA